jgi:hypothetical protein
VWEDGGQRASGESMEACARHAAPQPTWQVRSWLGRGPPSR